jgi:hypothetical protein
VLHSIATPYTTSNKAAELHPTQGSKEATPSSGKETSSDVVIRSTKEGAKGSKKRHKQCPQGATATTDHDDGDGNDRKAGSSSRGASRLPHAMMSIR